MMETFEEELWSLLSLSNILYKISFPKNFFFCIFKIKIENLGHQISINYKIRIIVNRFTNKIIKIRFLVNKEYIYRILI